MRRIVVFLLAICLVLPMGVCARAAELEVAGKSALLMDMETGTVLYNDLMVNLTRENIAKLEPLSNVIPFKLEKSTTHTYEISFSMPLNSDIALMGTAGNFDFHAEAVQADNNDNMEFNDSTDTIDIDEAEIPETDDSTVESDTTEQTESQNNQTN